MIDPALIGKVAAVAGAGALAVVAMASTMRRARRRQRRAAPDAFARHVDGLRNGLSAREAMTDARLARIEQMIEVLSVEVERVGESQRFVSKLLADDRADS